MNSTFEGIPASTLDIVTAVFCYNLIVGLPANTCILWLILREARLASDIFYFNLSSGEILFCMSEILFFVGCEYHLVPILEAFLFFRGIVFTARPLFQCLICAECYVGVNHPVLFLRLRPLRYRLTCCAVSWLFVAVSCIYNMYTFSDPHHLLSFFIQNAIFLWTVLYCLVSVLQTLTRPQPGGSNKQKKSNRTKSRAFKIVSVTMAIMVVNFLLCIGPIPLQFCLQISTFWYVFTICISVSSLNSTMQPLIYLQRCEKILCFRLH